MKSFGFERGRTSGRQKWIQQIDAPYVFVLFFLFIIFSALALLYSFYKGKEDITSVQKIIGISNALDPELSQALYYTKHISQAVINQEPLFPDYLPSFETLISISSGLDSKRGSYLPHNQQYLRNRLREVGTYKADIYSLLGQDSPQTYLIILQNTAEKRPNGGFFGSFMKITLDKGRVTDRKMIDSYLPGFDKPGTHITGPERLLNFLPDRDIYFIGANKIGFTYHDGAHIQTLYEKSYPGQRIRGVVFVSTDMFTSIMPDFREQLWEWQFINASIDLIRGKPERGKKELYLASANKYFTTHAKTLTQHIITHLGQLIQQRYINLYLTNISGSLHTWLRKEKLTTRFENDTMYFWDSNISYSKVDAFVNKIIQFRDASGTVVIETMNDIVPIGHLSPGMYTISIIYNLHVPAYYIDFINQLTKKYGIELSEREIHILAIKPTWATRGVVYMPQHISLQAIDGDRYYEDDFITPFSKNIYYKAKMLENNSVSEVVMEVEISEK